MKINLLGEEFAVVDTKEKITIADSFVVPANKIGSGHGESKLYLGNDNETTRTFFGGDKFALHCFLLKKDLLQYLNETKVEYLNPEQPYLESAKLPKLWIERKQKIDSLPEKIDFTLVAQAQITGPRVYAKSSDEAYQIIRELSLPNITFISAVKLLNKRNHLEYYFRLFADYFGDTVHPYALEEEKKSLNEITDTKERATKTRARIGQGKYREELLSQCPFCPMTMVTDDRILIASHIKPWAKSNELEQTDPYNGLMLTPTFDYLFDKGFMSFTSDKRTILSPFLSKITYSKINLADNKIITQLPIEGREKYLEYHRNEILKR